MELIVETTGKLKGDIVVPGSKSHTIRGVVIASLADGISTVRYPLNSADTLAAVNGCRQLGADITTQGDKWIINGFNGNPHNPGKPLYLANSGTSMNLLTGIVSLGNFDAVLDGDESLRTRPVQPLLDALKPLGVHSVSLQDNGKPPIRIRGRIKGGNTRVNGVSSQFISSLLIVAPLAEKDTEIDVEDVREVPYIEMTLKWLDEQGIVYGKNDGFTRFSIKGGQRYRSFEKAVPADWSSATFFLVAGAVTESDILLTGLDINDVQGDKAVAGYLKKMGAEITVEEDGVRIRGGRLKGAELNLNDTPDALPAMAVAGCFAEGTTRIFNVAHARIKETDRIKVMAEELKKMNADIKETEDGLIINHSELTGASVKGHHDHRVVMALSLAGMVARGITRIDTAESVDVTFPGFVELMKNIGAKIKTDKG